MHNSITSLLDKHYELVWVDQGSNLDNSLEEVQKAIQTQEWQPIDESIDEWLFEAQWEGEKCALDKLTEDIAESFDVPISRAERFVDDYRDDLTQMIDDRDNSDVIKDLIRHTDNPVFFYDTGEYIENPYDENELTAAKKYIKKVLKIKGKDQDKNIEELLINASYGGRLVIYFRADIEDMMKLSGNNTITFTNPMVAIIDTGNGSGHNVEFEKHDFSLPLDTNNIYIDKCIKYSYVYEVCGMYGSFCDCTDVKFSKSKARKTVKESTLHNELANEELYNKTFKAGGCTPGDMDYKRHHHKVYVNNFPCGTHCLDCGTFWID